MVPLVVVDRAAGDGNPIAPIPDVHGPVAAIAAAKQDKSLVAARGPVLVGNDSWVSRPAGGLDPQGQAEILIAAKVEALMVLDGHVIIHAIELQGIRADLAGGSLVGCIVRAGVQRGLVCPGGGVGDSVAVGGLWLIEGEHQQRVGAEVESLDFGRGEGAVEDARVVNKSLPAGITHMFAYAQARTVLPGCGGVLLHLCTVDVQPAVGAIPGVGHVRPGIVGNGAPLDGRIHVQAAITPHEQPRGIVAKFHDGVVACRAVASVFDPGGQRELPTRGVQGDIYLVIPIKLRRAAAVTGSAGHGTGAAAARAGAVVARYILEGQIAVLVRRVFHRQVQDLPSGGRLVVEGRAVGDGREGDLRLLHTGDLRLRQGANLVRAEGAVEDGHLVHRAVKVSSRYAVIVPDVQGARVCRVHTPDIFGLALQHPIHVELDGRAVVHPCVVMPLGDVKAGRRGELSTLPTTGVDVKPNVFGILVRMQDVHIPLAHQAPGLIPGRRIALDPRGDRDPIGIQARAVRYLDIVTRPVELRRVAVFAALPGSGAGAAAAHAVVLVAGAVHEGGGPGGLLQVELEHGAGDGGRLGDDSLQERGGRGGVLHQGADLSDGEGAV